MTSKVEWKGENLTPYISETPKNIETKVGLNDCVIDPCTLRKFLEIGPTGSSPHTAENNITHF